MFLPTTISRIIRNPILMIISKIKGHDIAVGTKKIH